jgi:hypothetical protein
MVDNYVKLNLRNYIRSEVYQGKILFHTHLNRM